MMTSKEIVQNTFSFKTSHRIPNFLFMEEELIKKLPDEYKTKVTSDIYGGHVLATAETALSDGYHRDLFGTVIHHGKITSIVEPALESPSLKGYTWPKAEEMADWEDLYKKYKNKEDKFRGCGMCYGFFERAYMMRGFENILMDMVLHPDFVDELMEKYLELRKKTYEIAVQAIPFEAFFDGGDDCDQRGIIFGLEKWQHFIRPRLVSIVDACHKLGKPVIAHMCGNVSELIPDLLEMKLDALESLQPETMDIFEIKKQVKGKMVLIGGMGVQQTMPFATPDTITSETKRLITEMNDGSGYIVSPSKALMEDVPVENAIAFIDAIYKYGGYENEVS